MRSYEEYNRDINWNISFIFIWFPFKAYFLLTIRLVKELNLKISFIFDQKIYLIYNSVILYIFILSVIKDEKLKENIVKLAMIMKTLVTLLFTIFFVLLCVHCRKMSTINPGTYLVLYIPLFTYVHVIAYLLYECAYWLDDCYC